MLLAGEPSGDDLGAHLIEALTAKNPDLRFTGIGGPWMRRQGLRSFYSTEHLSIMGFVDVLKHLPKIRQVMHLVKTQLTEDRPDCLVLIDYPGFNLRVAKYAHSQGIPVVFYVSPQIWAWRAGRIHAIKKTVDHMAVLFSFEKALYDNAGIPVSFVGHPLARAVPLNPNRRAALNAYALHDDAPIIGLLPGSRHQEINTLLPILLDTADRIKKIRPNAQFIIPVTNAATKKSLQTQCDRKDLHLINIAKPEHGLTKYDVLSLCHVAIAASGTVTLELALLNIPTLIIYKVGWINYWLAKMVVKTPYIGLCNIVAQTLMAPEFIQEDASPDVLADKACQFIANPPALPNIRNALTGPDGIQPLIDTIKVFGNQNNH